MKCDLCGKCYNTKGFSSHLRNSHNITNKQYYDLYIKEPNENKCLLCRSKTNFISITKGYSKHCSVKCSSLDKNVKAKTKNTCIAKYGVANSFKTKKCIENSHSSIAKKKRLETLFSKYQITSPFSSTECRKKSLNTLYLKYHVTNPYNIPKIQHKCIEASKTNIAKQKRYITRKDNGWNRSSCEEYFKEILKKLDIFYKHNYKSDQYPWKVDFYLEKYSLYIELNVFWTHGFHYYDYMSEEDNNCINAWNKQNNGYYKKAIDIWTQNDIQKRDWAINNNLNYIVLWNMSQINTFLESITTTSYEGFNDFNNIQIN